MLASVGMGILMLLNAGILVLFNFNVLGRVFLLTCSIPSFVFLYILSPEKRFRFLLTFCLVDTFCLWIMTITNLLDYYVGGGKSVLMFISRLIAFPLAEYYTYHFLRKPYLELQDGVERGWSVFAFMTMLYYVLLSVVSLYPNNIVNRPEDILVCVLVLLLMILTYAIMFSALYRQLLLHRKRQSERILLEQKHSLEMQLENQQQIRKLKHDMKGHVIALSGLLTAGKVQEATEYLKNMESETDPIFRPLCANLYLNAVFSHYFQKFQEQGAEIRLDIRIGEEELPYMELCQILSNGLENAWEAMRELPVREREASVQMKYIRDYLIIRIKNKCRKELVVEKGTLPVSIKSEAGHGFGLRTIQEAAKRLGGEMFCYTDKGNFVLDVMVNVKY